MNGFLDTKGQLHKCESYEHLDFAVELVEEMGITVHNRLAAEDYLQKLGWVVVRTNDIYGFIGYVKDGKNSDERYHLTEEQKKWLLDNYDNMTANCRESVDEMFRKDERI